MNNLNIILNPILTEKSSTMMESFNKYDTCYLDVT